MFCMLFSVYDNELNQAVVMALLGSLQMRIDVAGNGMEAFQTIQQKKYDIVFMDHYMPGMEAVMRIRYYLPERMVIGTQGGQAGNVCRQLPDSHTIITAHKDQEINDEIGKKYCGECGSFVCFLLHTFACDMEQSGNGERTEQCRRWGKIIGGIYDDRLLVKPVKAARDFMPDAEPELPYEGAKEMLAAAALELGRYRLLESRRRKAGNILRNHLDSHTLLRYNENMFI